MTTAAYIPRFGGIGRFATLVFMTLFLAMAAVACGDDDEGDVAILECDGNCSCNDVTRTCSCSGGTECTIEGEGNLRFTCDGNASCDLNCGNDCEIVCPGTTGCTAEAGEGASFECQGNAICEFTCRANCSVRCAGAAQCLVTCDDTEPCNLDECQGSTDCGNGVFACGRACP
jgi:hypothetical protein